MEALRQKIRVPKNHEITIHVPSAINENELAEIVLFVNQPSQTYEEKIALMKEAMNDKDFVSEIKEVMEDFKYVDAEWFE